MKNNVIISALFYLLVACQQNGSKDDNKLHKDSTSTISVNKESKRSSFNQLSEIITPSSNSIWVYKKEAISLNSIFNKTNIDRIGINPNDSSYFFSAISRKTIFCFPAVWCKLTKTISRNRIAKLDRKERRISYNNAFVFFALSRPIFLENQNEYWIYIQWNGLGDDGGTEARRYTKVDNDFVQTHRQILQIR